MIYDNKIEALIQAALDVLHHDRDDGSKIDDYERAELRRQFIAVLGLARRESALANKIDSVSPCDAKKTDGTVEPMFVVFLNEADRDRVTAALRETAARPASFPDAKPE